MALPRMTTRRWMLGVAAVALACGVAGRVLRFRRLAEYHLARSSADVVSDMLTTHDGTPTFIVETGTGAPTTPARVEWHRRLLKKYERAARRPWLPVPPDPPEPE
jgi:hypothetical protein